MEKGEGQTTCFDGVCLTFVHELFSQYEEKEFTEVLY